MVELQLSDVQVNKLTDKDYFGPSGELLLGRGTLVSTHHVEALKRRGISKLFIKAETGSDEVKKILESELTLSDLHLGDEPVAKKAQPESNITDVRFQLEQLLSSKSVVKMDQRIETGNFKDSPTGAPLKKILARKLPSQRSATYKQQLMGAYNNAMGCVKDQLHRIDCGLEPEASSVRAITEKFLSTFTQDSDLLINLAHSKPSDKNYLITHSMNVSILSIAIATAYGFSEEQVMEIGMGALLHDIGMVMIPESIRSKDARVNSDEWYEIQKHPIFGLHTLEKVKQIPESVLLIAYQVHERENGTGYPKQRTSRLIHNFARIVQIADIYEALSSPRQYRKAYPPHKAVEILLKMTSQGFICGRCVKAFLEHIALFPVGSLVELSSGQTGKVIRANGSAYTKPMVRILFDSRGNPLEEQDQYEEDLATNTALRITRALDQSIKPVSLMQGF